MDGMSELRVCTATSHRVVFCLVMLPSMPMMETKTDCVCVLVLMFGVRYVPSVMPQSEISPAANNSKTRKQPKGRRNYKVEPLASVFSKTKVDILHIFRCQFVILALRLNTFFRKLRLNRVHWYFSKLIIPPPVYPINTRAFDKMTKAAWTNTDPSAHVLLCLNHLKTVSKVVTTRNFLGMRNTPHFCRFVFCRLIKYYSGFQIVYACEVSSFSQPTVYIRFETNTAPFINVTK